MKEDWIVKMGAVAKDIINIKKRWDEDLTHAQLMVRFYKIMRKHGIKQGSWSKDGRGRICNNFEWTMCLALLKDSTKTELMMAFGGAPLPKDLEAYGKKPKIK